MEQDYDWNLIGKVAFPIALLEIITFYVSFLNWFKILLLIFGMIIAGAIMYYYSKKKQNIFTAVAIVFLAGLVMRFLANVGLISP